MEDQERTAMPVFVIKAKDTFAPMGERMPKMIVGPGDYMAMVGPGGEWPLDTSADTATCPRCGFVLAVAEDSTMGELADLIEEHRCG